MYLTNTDLEYIASHATHGLQDLPRIDAALKTMKYLDWDTNEEMTREQVLESMERNEFFDACISAAFRGNTFRDSREGNLIFFNAAVVS